jgi:hypothetical protein
MPTLVNFYFKSYPEVQVLGDGIIGRNRPDVYDRRAGRAQNGVHGRGEKGEEKPNDDE